MNMMIARKSIATILFTFLLVISFTFTARAQQKMASYEAYDQYGNILQAKDANGNEIRYYYGTAAAPFSQSGKGIYLTGIQRVKGEPDDIPSGGSRPSGGDDLFSDAEYNSKGELVRLRDENWIVTEFKYDGLGRLTAIVDAEGNTLESYSYVYSANRNSGVFDPDSPNYIQTTRHMEGGKNRKSRQYMDGLGRPIQTVTTDGDSLVVTATEYDGRGREWRNWKTFRAAGTTPGYQEKYKSSARSYYGNGHPFSETHYEASPLDRPVEQLPPGKNGGVKMNYGIKDIDNDPVQFTETVDEVNNTSRTFTDGWGRTVRTVAGMDTNEQAITGFEYNIKDELIEVRHPNDYDRATYPGDWTTTYDYDPLGNMIQKSNADAGTARYAYDKGGNLRFRQDARQDSLGHVWFGRYDELGRPAQSGVARFDNGVNFAAFRDSTNKLTNIEENGRNWITANSWDQAPDPDEFPWSVFPGEIQNVQLQNTKGQLAAAAFRTDPQYPAHVSLEGEWITGTASFTATDSITTKNTIVGAGGDVELTAGRRIVLRPYTQIEEGAYFHASIDPRLAPKEGGASMQRAIVAASTYKPDDGATWRLTLHSYDERGRLADKWTFTRYHPLANTHIAYEYNKADEITHRTIRVGESWEKEFHQWMEYDQRGNLTDVYASTGTARPADPVITYTYTSEGQVRARTLGNTTSTYAYNLRGWIKKINDTSDPSAPFAAFYDYTDNGNVEKAQFYNSDPNFSLPNTHRHYHQGFTYDGLNRLTAADYGYGEKNSSSWFDVKNLTYDRAGNLKSLHRNDETGNLIDQLRYDYSGNNRLQAVTDNIGVAYDTLDWPAKSATFDYDPNGNLIARVETEAGADSTRFAYDHRNLPLKVTLPDGGSARFRYTADGQRYLKEASGEETFYILDGPQTLAVMKEDTLRWWNITGQGIEGRRDAESDSLRYYLKDHLGSTRAVVDNSGEVLESFDYYPFGLLMPKRNTTGAGTMEKFTGKERDEAIGLDYFGARYYDAALGRWHGVDPRDGDYSSWSPYNYALNNPTGNIDPDGEFVLSFLAGFARGIFSGKRIGESFGMGVQSVRNSADILSSFVRGNFGQIVSKFTWQLPQQALGVLGGNIRNFAGDIRNISHDDGATLIETNSGGWGGFTLGSVIQAQRSTKIGSYLYRHEFGHFLQSQRLGLAYLPSIALPSLGSAGFNDYRGHSRFYTERWADRLSKRFFDNRTEEAHSENSHRQEELVPKDNDGKWRRQDEEDKLEW